MTHTTPADDQRRRIYRQLLQGFASSQHEDNEARWAWLMAAHTVGQHDYGLHWRIHLAMLRFAAASSDYTEVAGQLFRLALVPFGHALGRLPLGNSGRATVNAFEPMTPDARTAGLIAEAEKQAL